MPDSSDSAWKTGKKVILSFRQEEKVRLVAEKLRSYVVYLTHHAVTNVLSESKAVLGATAPSTEQFRMLQWLSNEDPSVSHNRAVHRKQEGTGSWYLESAEFTHWRNSPRSLAWLHGIRRWCTHHLILSMFLTVSSWLWQDDSMVGLRHQTL
ncbi:MAG: hypothetical protein Q9221_003270 [Calogaya cf. arnoldii]